MLTTLILLAYLVFPGSYAACDSCECTKLQTSDKCISIQKGWVNFLEAVTNCTAMGGRLFEPKDHYEDLEVHSLMDGDHYWIGLEDMMNEGRWVYHSTQSTPPCGYYNGWQQNQPDDWQGRQDCAYAAPENFLGGGPDKFWDDVNCSVRLRYVCECDLAEA